MNRSRCLPFFAPFTLAATSALLAQQPVAGRVPALPAPDLDRKAAYLPETATLTPPKPAPGSGAVVPAAARGGAQAGVAAAHAAADPVAGQVLFDTDRDGSVWALAASYKAHVAADGFTYVPFLGSDSPRDHPITFSIEAAEAGSSTMPLAAAPVRRTGTTVTIARGALEERYEFGATQVEQKFVVARPFAGRLSLTLRVATDLTVGRDGQGLRFAHARGAVGYTDAVLVDANGVRVPMHTAHANGRIILQVEAPALSALAFPLTVDPVLSTTVAYSHATQTVRRADIAHSNVSGHYLTVFERVFSAADTDVHAVAIDGAGSLVAGSETIIDVTTDAWSDPRVAACDGNFLVVASRLAQAGGTRAIWGRTRAVGAPTTGAPFEISTNESGDKTNPDVGGEFDGPDYFCVVWQRTYSPSDHDIHYRMIDDLGAPVAPTQAIANSIADDFTPRIAKTDGAGPTTAQFWPVVWSRFNGLDSDIWGARVHRSGSLATAPFVIDNGNVNDSQPSVSSLSNIDGVRHFVVAYTTDAFVGVGNGLDVFLRVFRDGTSPLVTHWYDLHALEGGLRIGDQFRPQIDSDGCRFAVAYLDAQTPGADDAYVSTVGLTNGRLSMVDPRVPLDTSTAQSTSAALVGARMSAFPSLTFGFAVDVDAANQHRVLAGRYRGVAPAGGFAVRATGCSGLNLSNANGSQLPAPGQVLRFDVGGAQGPTFLLVGWPMAAVQICPPQPCALGVDPSGYVLVPGSTLQLGVPCAANLVGATLAVQGGALASLSGCGQFANLALTNTLDVTLQ